MRILRLIIISFILFFLLGTAFSLMIPSHVRISKAINIKGDKDTIMAAIKDPARWKEWYPGQDSTQLLYVDGQVKGVVMKKADSTELAHIIITKSSADEVNAEFEGKKQRPVQNVWRTIKYASNDSVTLQWYMEFHLHWYPWEKFASLMLEGSYAPIMEKGLHNIKRNVEN